MTTDPAAPAGPVLGEEAREIEAALRTEWRRWYTETDAVRRAIAVRDHEQRDAFLRIAVDECCTPAHVEVTRRVVAALVAAAEQRLRTRIAELERLAASLIKDERAAEQRGAAAERERIRDAVLAMVAALYTVKPALDAPYPDTPEWTPWTRFVDPAVEALCSAAGLS